MPWKFAKNVLITPIEPEAVLLNTVTGENYVLNPLGLAICALIQEGCNETAAIIDRINQHFPDDASAIAVDVAEFIADLQSEGLLEEVTAGNE
jgi:Coenzyme PQQ synthesis protein D (PqqD)